ncbi:MAG TPA: prephenate dehydrogenase/arogenate dehydrogenase family protein [Candidatus Dormibacteraeota bacterium]|nr:prephenate dehydrogenase/arogenate dehydrogenase family protein [Candidatus Dormibacteraeota bacterium]
MRVGIVGLGLIGGSLGMALRRIDPAIEVSGLTRSAEAAAEAPRRGAASRASSDLSVLDGSDVVVLATPIDQIPTILDRLAHLQTRGTLITDVASVKRPVRDWVRRIPEPGLFLGGHPVAGKAQSGLGAADPEIFRDEPWIFTPLEAQNLRPFDDWVALVRAIGARPFFLSPEEHDRQMAYLSHLAFTVSSAFAEVVRRNADSHLGGPGYRSMARLAGGDARMYESISRQNRQRLLEAIARFSDILQEFRDHIERQEEVLELFEAHNHVAV